MPPFWETLGNIILIGGGLALTLFIIAALLTIKGNLIIFKADDLLEEAAAQGEKMEEGNPNFFAYNKLEVMHERFILVAMSLLILMTLIIGATAFNGFLKYNSTTQSILAEKVMSEVNSTYAVNITLEQARMLSGDRDDDDDLYNVVDVLHANGNTSVPVAIRNIKDEDVLVYYEKGVKAKDLKEVKRRP
jgi:hypothetical protein